MTYRVAKSKVKNAMKLSHQLHLTDSDNAMLNGADGEALQFAMLVVVRAASVMGAAQLTDVSFVHIDACHYYGRAHLDFAQFFLDHNARFKIPAWTNTIPVSLKPDQETRGDANVLALREARELARLYVDLGSNPVWTCAPYQLPNGPQFGDNIVVGESNAVSYYNSAVGARTNKYSDFLDVCAGLTGRAPLAGLHTDEGRRASIVFDVSEIPLQMRQTELFCHVLGIVMGQHAANRVPVVCGLPSETPGDSLKALAAAGASSGGITMYHAVGVTPEANSLAQATGGVEPQLYIKVSPQMLIDARNLLSPVIEGELSMVAVGTPHFSISEFERAVKIFNGRKIRSDMTFYISTSRFVANLVRERGWYESLVQSGVSILEDTCTYFSPAVRAAQGRVMTNSAKWAYYAPGMLPVEVAFGSLDECIESAVSGYVVRDPILWSNDMWGL